MGATAGQPTGGRGLSERTRAGLPMKISPTQECVGMETATALMRFRRCGIGEAPYSTSMKSILRQPVFLAVLLAIVTPAFATDMADVVKAQVILSKVLEYAAKYQVQTGTIEAPLPLTSNKGKYFVPYNAEGQITEWATKTLNTQLGAAIGAKAGEEAGKQVASRVPFGGLASGLMKKKGKEMGAVAAIGGTEYIRKTSALSFNNLDDLAVYMHVKHGSSGDYAQALAAAMAIYPALETSYDRAIRGAYQRAQQTQGTK
jgi:hypothetical protein